ncbi:MAG: hypothetical protein ACK2UQ_09365 [Anaerolineae bacterium]
MSENKTYTSPISKTALVTALGFGLAALIVRAASLRIPVVGTHLVSDPRELFVTLGAALSGPVGGMLCGFMANNWFGEDSIALISDCSAHILGGLWMGLTYKNLMYARLKMPSLLLGWGGLVFIYYYLVVIPVFVGVTYTFFPALVEQLFGALSFGQAYTTFAQAATPEFVITLLITGIILAILPPKYRRPLW